MGLGVLSMPGPPSWTSEVSRPLKLKTHSCSHEELESGGVVSIGYSYFGDPLKMESKTFKRGFGADSPRFAEEHELLES